MLLGPATPNSDLLRVAVGHGLLGLACLLAALALAVAAALRSGAARPDAAAPPAILAIPASPSLIPSIRPSAPADPCSVCVMKLGRIAVVISCPASLKKLAAPMLATPRVSQRFRGNCSPTTSARTPRGCQIASRGAAIRGAGDTSL
jgi:hypothetical protein